MNIKTTTLIFLNLKSIYCNNYWGKKFAPIPQMATHYSSDFNSIINQYRADFVHILHEIWKKKNGTVEWEKIIQ